MGERWAEERGLSRQMGDGKEARGGGRNGRGMGE